MDVSQNPYDLDPAKVVAGKIKSSQLKLPRPWVLLTEIEHLSQVLQNEGCSPDLITFVFENSNEYQHPWRLRAVGEVIPLAEMTNKAPSAKEGASIGISF